MGPPAKRVEASFPPVKRRDFYGSADMLLPDIVEMTVPNRWRGRTTLGVNDAIPPFSRREDAAPIRLCSTGLHSLVSVYLSLGVVLYLQTCGHEVQICFTGAQNESAASNARWVWGEDQGGGKKTSVPPNAMCLVFEGAPIERLDAGYGCTGTAFMAYISDNELESEKLVQALVSRYKDVLPDKSRTHLAASTVAAALIANELFATGVVASEAQDAILELFSR